MAAAHPNPTPARPGHPPLAEPVRVGAAAGQRGCPATPDPTPPRVLVVRDADLAQRLQHAVNAAVEVRRVPGFLAALADLAHNPDAAVIGPADALAGLGPPAATAAALHRLAPHARAVILLDQTPAGEQPHQALGQLPGAVLPATADDDTLLHALGLHDYRRRVHATPDFADDPHRRTLGDTDLLDTILGNNDDGHTLAGLALRILQQQTADDTLSFTPGSEPPSQNDADNQDDHPAPVRVCFEGVTYGHLTRDPHHPAEHPNGHGSPPPDPETLRPYADWLARWLALDHQHRQFRDLALRDELTACWNRRYFNRFLRRILDRAATERRQVTLMVFDIDDFKHYNDRFGHAAGDDILRDTAKLMQSVVREHDVVARIGGDEFAVIFWDAGGPRHEGSHHPGDVLEIAERFQRRVGDLRFPKLADTCEPLTVSAGLAGFPWDGRTPDELLHHADLMALESKRKGKNALTYGRR